MIVGDCAIPNPAHWYRLSFPYKHEIPWRDVVVWEHPLILLFSCVKQVGLKKIMAQIAATLSPGKNMCKWEHNYGTTISPKWNITKPSLAVRGRLLRRKKKSVVLLKRHAWVVRLALQVGWTDNPIKVNEAKEKGVLMFGHLIPSKELPIQTCSKKKVMCNLVLRSRKSNCTWHWQ